MGISRNKKIRRFPSPYDKKETLAVLKRMAFGIKPGNKKTFLDYLPQHYILNGPFKNPDKTVNLGFIGDIMDMAGKNVGVGEEVKKYLSDCDFLVGNFEATITDLKKRKGVLIGMEQKHIPQILDMLADLFEPSRFYLNLANNHAGDFGFEVFKKSLSMIEDRGFKVFGTTDRPYADLPSELPIRIIAGTMWSNQICDYIIYLEESPKFIRNDAFNILYPHWSHELEYLPREYILKKAENLIKEFDMIIGHHSHCPQPIIAVDRTDPKIGPYPPPSPGDNTDNTVIAFGLGDFCIGTTADRFIYGYVLKSRIVSVNGKYLPEKIEYRFTRCGYEKDRKEYSVRFSPEGFPLWNNFVKKNRKKYFRNRNRPSMYSF